MTLTPVGPYSAVGVTWTVGNASVNPDEDGYWTNAIAEEADRFRKRRDAQGRRSRPKVPTICTRPISVAQVLADTANPARTLGVL